MTLRSFDRRPWVPLLMIVISAIVVSGNSFACDKTAHLRIMVETEFMPMEVRSDYTLDQISDLARKVQSDGDRPGFYLSVFSYGIRVASDEVCPEDSHVFVTFRLAKRVIELGQEVDRDDCLRPIVIGHYQRMASADEAEVMKYAALATATLSAAAPGLRAVPLNGSSGPDNPLLQRIRSIVDPVIANLHLDRSFAQQAINTAEEIKKLKSECSI